jgi:hypothetical protein
MGSGYTRGVGAPKCAMCRCVCGLEFPATPDLPVVVARDHNGSNNWTICARTGERPMHGMLTLSLSDDNAHPLE